MILKSPPPINASSMADIAFLLLVFFLMTTTVESELGIFRKLPPEDLNQTTIPKHKRNVLEVYVNESNQIMADGEIVENDELKELVKKFILNNTRKSTWPEFEAVYIPLLGTREVSKQVISLQTDKATQYEQYILVQNELTAAYNELRNDLANKHFGKSIDHLEDAGEFDKLKALKAAYPMRISEAEPR
jgi:biopolymer transport protein ExbD